MKNKTSQQKKSSSKDIFETVWEVVRLIPKGRVTSYGAIASYIGSGLSARVVGYAMNASHNSSLKIPAHRVVNRNGLLTGKHHFSHPFHMQELLEKEGLTIINNQINEFKKHFWDPIKELKL